MKTEDLTTFQKELLARAAEREMYADGSIQHIMLMAMIHGDVDTVSYIHKHYFTTQHFEQETLDKMEIVIAAAEAMDTVTH